MTSMKLVSQNPSMLAQSASPKPAPASTPAQSREAAARKAFDSFFLQAAIEQALPKKAEAVFGRGFSADVMRSMLAERVAAEIAKRPDFSITGKALTGFTPAQAQPERVSIAPAATSPVKGGGVE